MLYLSEKFHILFSKERLLNKRNEIISKYRNVEKCRIQLFYLFHYQQNIYDKMTWNNGSCTLFDYDIYIYIIYIYIYIYIHIHIYINVYILYIILYIYIHIYIYSIFERNHNAWKVSVLKIRIILRVNNAETTLKKIFDYNVSVCVCVCVCLRPSTSTWNSYNIRKTNQRYCVEDVILSVQSLHRYF